MPAASSDSGEFREGPSYPSHRITGRRKATDAGDDSAAPLGGEGATNTCGCRKDSVYLQNVRSSDRIQCSLPVAGRPSTSCEIM